MADPCLKHCSTIEQFSCWPGRRGMSLIERADLHLACCSGGLGSVLRPLSIRSKPSFDSQQQTVSLRTEGLVPLSLFGHP